MGKKLAPEPAGVKRNKQKKEKKKVEMVLPSQELSLEHKKTVCTHVCHFPCSACTLSAVPAKPRFTSPTRLPQLPLRIQGAQALGWLLGVPTTDSSCQETPLGQQSPPLAPVALGLPPQSSSTACVTPRSLAPLKPVPSLPLPQPPQGVPEEKGGREAKKGSGGCKKIGRG